MYTTVTIMTTVQHTTLEEQESPKPTEQLPEEKAVHKE